MVTGSDSGEEAVMFLKVLPPGAATFAPYDIVSGELNINFRLLDTIILQQKAKADICAGTMSIYNIIWYGHIIIFTEYVIVNWEVHALKNNKICTDIKKVINNTHIESIIF